MTVYTGVAGGNRTNGRPQLEEVLKDLADRRADALIVTKLDRVSRSVRSCLPWSRMILSDGAGKQWGPGGC
jgi:DNA invertase Pin-like site-specific DNA recombinase